MQNFDVSKTVDAWSSSIFAWGQTSTTRLSLLICQILLR
jgi:hypothetical protein